MTTRECPYCGTTNAPDADFCASCGIPQVSGQQQNQPPEPGTSTPTLSKPKSLGVDFSDPTVRWLAIGAAAVVVFVVGFVMGRLSAGSGEDAIAAPATTPTAIAPTTAPAPGGSEITTTTSAAPTTTSAKPTTTSATPTTTEALFAYTDIPDGHPNAAAINQLIGLGIVAGCDSEDETLFCPDSEMTRGDMAALLAAALQLSDSGTTDLFTDDNGSPYEEAIQQIAVAGISAGCNPPDNTEFCPERPLTRGHVAAFLVRGFGYSDTGASDLFADDNGSVFEADIQRVATAGVLAGCSDEDVSLVCPTDPVTRGQMAELLARALG